MKSVEQKICCVFNYAPHYRKSIFQKMDEELKCDFYFGDNVFTNLQKMDYSILNGFKAELRNKRFRSFKWQTGIRKVISKKYSIYIITGDPSYLSNWLLLIYSIVKGKQLYLWCHGLRGKNMTLIERFLINTFYKSATGGLLLYGKNTYELMMKKGYSDKKLDVIFNSLDYDEQFYLRQNLVASDIYLKHFNNNDPVIIFVGRLQKSKKIEMIYEAQKLLANNSVFFNTVIIGEGEMEQSLKSIWSNNDLSKRVWFYGPCYQEDIIAPMIFNATLTVSPGDIGLTAIHSLVYGTPVLTHSNFDNHGPEFEAITTGLNGDFFEENNIVQLTEKISEWINKSIANRDLIRKTCYKTIDSFYNPNYQIKLLKSILQ